MFDDIVLGCALFGGLGSLTALRDNGIDRDTAFRLMDVAWDMGIRRFDTADAYGGGLSEQWIGEWMAARKRSALVTTKTFNPMSADGDTGLAPARIRRQIVSSLHRLGCDSIAAYLAHEWDPDVPIEATIEVFEDLVAAGTIAAYGFSNVTSDDMHAVVAAGSPSVVQNSYSLLRRTDEASLIPLCRGAGIRYEAYSPLAGGWLTGKYRPGEPLPAGSRMALVPQWYTHIDANRAAAAAAKFSERASDMGHSPTALALAWVRENPDVARIVVGPKRVEHLEPVIESVGIRLPDVERQRLASLFPA